MKNSSVSVKWLFRMLLQIRISTSKISLMKQMIHAWRMTFSRFRILNWLHWSRKKNSWRISKLRDYEYARIISRWNWNFSCNACKLSEWFFDLMRSSFVSISRRVYIVENSILLMQHVWTMFLQEKMLSLKSYWNVSMRWILIEFWIIQMQNHINILTTNSTSLTCDTDVDIAQNVAKKMRFRCIIRIRMCHLSMLNRKYRYFETLMSALFFWWFSI